MDDRPRLIERAFPLKQASLDSVHEKNVRHGHISTLHIWPARRPLAACRAALIATLLPDPGTPEERRKLCEMIAGKVVQKIEKKKMPNGRTVERIKEETEGGILHWKRETENAETLEWFRQEIRKAYGGRSPRVLDPFAGGGAIPLEAMRLGCEVTAVDINPVAWFILKCTLEYPQKLAGKTHPLPDFILEDEEFLAAFYKAHPHLVGETRRTKKQAREFEEDFFMKGKADSGRAPEADLAWHVRAWGQWVLDRARRELARFYPTYADFEPLKPGELYEKQPMRPVPPKDDGTADIGALNAAFSEEYLADPRNPRWVAKPTVAYLWARTVTCKNCRATVPLLKTRWLCKKDRKRLLLAMELREVGQASVPASEGQMDITRRRLPHWRLEESTYFVTWRLHRQQAPLTPQERSRVLEAIRHFDGQRYDLAAWVVMDDHVHVIVRPRSGHDLSAITHSWKSFTANRLQREHTRQNAVWQDESWDRIIRDHSEFEEKAQYILDNPRKRWPEVTEYPWAGVQEMAGTEACPTGKQVVFGIEKDVPVKGANAAQRREHDKRIGAGTMSRAGAQCPCCNTIMMMQDIRLEGRAGRLGAAMTAVVVDGQTGKEYRLPTAHEIHMAEAAEKAIPDVFAQIPFGLPEEPTPKGGSGASRAFSVDGYGFTQWKKLFTPRQLLALGVLVNSTRKCRDAMKAVSYSDEWAEAICAYLAVALDRTANYMSSVCIWENVAGEVKQTFLRFALPITWDFGEANPLSEADRYFNGAVSNVVRVLCSLLPTTRSVPAPSVLMESAVARKDGRFDLIVTDPPYYDAIPYSDLMDFFYIWLRRTLSGVSTAYDRAFAEPVGPKWDHVVGDGELIDDSSRHDGDAALSKKIYEDGMARAFEACSASLIDSGRLVTVFAHKQPDAWETLVSAMIRAGFVVDGSWPIQTEMRGGVRNFGRASLASSVWLVCKKRLGSARPGWDNKVLEEMRSNIATRLREFWDAGIRGPDFVWAATGPALEAYSKHPVVKKANDPGKTMEVGEFLSHVRRMVVDFVVGQVLSGGAGVPAGHDSAGTEARPTDDLAAADRMDAPTAYYLLHRHDFGLEEAPSGACILYATACGLSDHELETTWDILVRTGSSSGSQDEDEETEDADPDAEADPDSASDSGSKVKLKTWAQRKHKNMGYEAPGGQPVPLIDRIHRLMHLWWAGDVLKVDEYLDEHGLRRHELFRRLLQSLIELSPAGSDERSLLESLSNHVAAKGAVQDKGPMLFPKEEVDGAENP